MSYAAMHEHIRQDLMRLKKDRMNIVKGEQVVESLRIGPERLLRNKDQYVNDEKIFYNRRKSVWPVISEIVHIRKFKLRG